MVNVNCFPSKTSPTKSGGVPATEVVLRVRFPKNAGRKFPVRFVLCVVDSKASVEPPIVSELPPPVNAPEVV